MLNYDNRWYNYHAYRLSFWATFVVMHRHTNIYAGVSMLRKLVADQFNYNSSRKYLQDFLAEAAASVAPGEKVLDAGAGDCKYKALFAGRDYTATDFLLMLGYGGLVVRWWQRQGPQWSAIAHNNSELGNV